MVEGRLERAGERCFGFCPSVSLGSREGDQVIATIDRPSSNHRVGSARGGKGHPEPEQTQRVIIKVMGFQPPNEGAVQVVVKALGDGRHRSGAGDRPVRHFSER